MAREREPTPVGRLGALLNACAQEHDDQTLRIVQAASGFAACAHLRCRDTLQRDTRSPSAMPPCQRLAAARTASASVSQSTAHLFETRFSRTKPGAPSPRHHALSGIFDCPNRSFFASLSSSTLAGAVAKTVRAGVVSVNGQLAIQGVKLQHVESMALEEEVVRGFFDEIDANGDGAISSAEFLQGLQSMGLPTNRQYMDDLLRQYAAAGDGADVSYDRFRSYVFKQHSKMARAFRNLDVDGSGFLTEDSLMVALQSMGLAAQRADARKMISLLDSTQKVRVDFSQFCRYACLLPAAQVDNGNVAFCWVDSADFLDGIEYRLGMTPSKQTYQRLLAGGIAGVLSRSMVAPLERLRTIMMASYPPRSMPSCVSVMWADGALSGLFKGNMATVIKVLPASALQFAVYDGIKDVLRAVVPREAGGDLALWERLTAGCIAGAASSCVTYPLETIRTMMSMPGCSTGGFQEVALAALRQRGLLGLYRGYSSAIINEMLGTGLGFLAYETGNQIWERMYGRKPSAREKGIVGALSATVVMTATMPFELIMRRMQIASTPMGSHFQYTGTVDAFRQIMAKEGFGAFFRGSPFAYAKVVPSIGAMYMLYEIIQQAMAVGGLRKYDQDKQLMAKHRAAREVREEHRRLADAAEVVNPPPVNVPLERLADSKQAIISSHPVS